MELLQFAVHNWYWFEWFNKKKEVLEHWNELFKSFVIQYCQKIENNALFVMKFSPISNFGNQSLHIITLHLYLWVGKLLFLLTFCTALMLKKGKYVWKRVYVVYEWPQKIGRRVRCLCYCNPTKCLVPNQNKGTHCT